MRRLLRNWPLVALLAGCTVGPNYRAPKLDIQPGFVEAIPANRMGTPDEIATAIVFLLTDASRYVVGQTLNIDGGTILS